MYAGTVLEEGELVIQGKRSPPGDSRYEKIVAMIEETEKLKSSLENRAEKPCRSSRTVVIGRNGGYISFD